MRLSELLEEYTIDLIDLPDSTIDIPEAFWINPYMSKDEMIIDSTDDEHGLLLAKQPELFGLSQDDIEPYIDLSEPIIAENVNYIELLRLGFEQGWIRVLQLGRGIFELQGDTLKDLHQVSKILDEEVLLEKIRIEYNNGSNELKGKGLRLFLKTGKIPSTLINESIMPIKSLK